MEYASLLFLFHRFFNSDGKSEKVGKIPELPSGTSPTHIAAGCKIYVAAAGLLTCPALRAFPSCRCDRIVACAESTGPCGRDLQQRELLPIHTAFPFNSPPRGNHCTAKIRFYRQEASDPAEYFRETRPAALRSGPFRPRCVPFPADSGATLARALYLFRSAAAQQPQ